DFTVLSNDPFTIDPAQLHLLDIKKTVINGQIVYEK
ncbi:hypothetical protein P8847_20580, partial [Bacillus inaquosorum]|nr:hypothetical protein [Bacillus inaquosorum]